MKTATAPRLSVRHRLGEPTFAGKGRQGGRCADWVAS